MKSIAKLVKQHMAALLLLAVALTMSAGTLWAKYVTSLPVTTGLTLKVTLEYSIDKTSMQTALKSLESGGITTLKFVTGSAVPASATAKTTDGIQATGSGKINLYVDGTTAYIAPANSSDSTSVIYAPVDCKEFLCNHSGEIGIGTTCTTFDLENLDTSRVTNMASMFQGYTTNGTTRALTSIKFGEHFDTSNVTTMLNMFIRQENLASLDLTGFNTSKVITMESMFNLCTGLTTVTLGKDFKFVGTDGYLPGSAWYDQSQGSSAATMTPEKVATYQSNAAKAITYVSTKPTEETTKTATLDKDNLQTWLSAFSGATDLYFVDVAPVGTTLYSDDDGNAYVQDDSSTGQIGVYVGNGDSSTEVYVAPTDATTTMYAPVDCSNLLNGGQKYTCMTALKNIYLLALDTSNVTSMDGMFFENSSLEKIYVSDKFVTTSVTSTGKVFDNSSHLTGGADTKYDANNTNDVTYARVDSGTSNPGYFTAYTATTSTTSDTASDTTDASDTVTNVTNSYTIDTTALTGVTARQTTDEEETTNEN